jgi:hypothetical protein
MGWVGERERWGEREGDGERERGGNNLRRFNNIVEYAALSTHPDRKWPPIPES